MCLNKITRRKGLKQSGVGYVVGCPDYWEDNKMEGYFHDTIYSFNRWYKAKKIITDRMISIDNYEHGFHIFLSLAEAYKYLGGTIGLVIYAVEWDNPIVRGKTWDYWNVKQLTCIVARRRKITGVAE